MYCGNFFRLLETGYINVNLCNGIVSVVGSKRMVDYLTICSQLSLLLRVIFLLSANCV